MNVIIGLCHNYSGKVVTSQESLFACKRKLSETSHVFFVRLLLATAPIVWAGWPLVWRLRLRVTLTETRDSTCPRSTAKFYLSVSHVIAVVRRAVTQPRRSGQLPVAPWRRRRDVFESLRLQANKDSWKVTTFPLRSIIMQIIQWSCTNIE